MPVAPSGLLTLGAPFPRVNPGLSSHGPLGRRLDFSQIRAFSKCPNCRHRAKSLGRRRAHLVRCLAWFPRPVPLRSKALRHRRRQLVQAKTGWKPILHCVQDSRAMSQGHLTLPACVIRAWFSLKRHTAGTRVKRVPVRYLLKKRFASCCSGGQGALSGTSLGAVSAWTKLLLTR
jgi:hypothetical protein